MDESSNSICDLAEACAKQTDQALAASEFAAKAAALRETDVKREQDSLRQVFSELLAKNRSRIDGLAYPDCIKELVHVEFDRIETAFADAPDEFFTMKTHAYRSDLRILAFGRIPAGPEHLEIDGIPRSVLWRGGAKQAIRFLRLLASTGGARPFYVLHLGYGIAPSTFLLHYSKRAQKKMFLRVAECLRMHPEIRGVMAGSWWHDPVLEKIAPHMSYLRNGWIEKGAASFFWNTSDEVVSVATRNSPPRQELVAKGEYLPKAYMVAWPRRSMLAWAERQA